MTPGAAIFRDTNEEQDFRRAIEEAERELFPLALRLYGVPESQQLDIVRFLWTNPELAEILLVAVPHLERVFGNAYRYLELEHDPDGGEEELFGVILVKGEPEHALKLLRRFDEMWFSEITRQTDYRLNFTVEIEDDEPI